VRTPRPFVCDDCTGQSTLEAPLLRLALRESDNPMRAVMVYFGPMNVYSRRAGPHLTEIVCGVEEVWPLLRWLTHRLHGKVASDTGVFVSLVSTEALVSEAVRQGDVKEGVAA
jgi:hypothetical protein